MDKCLDKLKLISEKEGVTGYRDMFRKHLEVLFSNKNSSGTICLDSLPKT